MDDLLRVLACYLLLYNFFFFKCFALINCVERSVVSALRTLIGAANRADVELFSCYLFYLACGQDEE